LPPSTPKESGEPGFPDRALHYFVIVTGYDLKYIPPLAGRYLFEAPVWHSLSMIMALLRNMIRFFEA